MKNKLSSNDLYRLQKKGQKALNSKMTALIGGVVIVFLVVALVPEIFSEIAGLETNADVPVWLFTVITVIVSAGFVFLIWRTFN